MTIVLTIIGVLVLALGSGFFALRLNALEEKRSYDLAVVAKVIASVCFVLLGLLCALWCKDQYWKLVTPIALVFGLVGDVLLALSLKQRNNHLFLIGGIAFAVEQYIHLMLMVSVRGGTIIFGLIFLLALGFVMLYLAHVYQVNVGKMGVGVVCYFVILLLMAGISFGSMLLEFTFGSLLFFIGALLISGSDALLLLHNFGTLKERRFANLVNLTCYAGQVLFALALLAR